IRAHSRKTSFRARRGLPPVLKDDRGEQFDPGLIWRPNAASRLRPSIRTRLCSAHSGCAFVMFQPLAVRRGRSESRSGGLATAESETQQREAPTASAPLVVDTDMTSYNASLVKGSHPWPLLGVPILGPSSQSERSSS